jgi:hypothetical protein
MKRTVMLCSGLLLLGALAVVTACGGGGGGSGKPKTPAAATATAAAAATAAQATSGPNGSTTEPRDTLSPDERRTAIATKIQGESTADAIDQATERAQEDQDRTQQAASRATRDANRATRAAAPTETPRP